MIERHGIIGVVERAVMRPTETAAYTAFRTGVPASSSSSGGRTPRVDDAGRFDRIAHEQRHAADRVGQSSAKGLRKRFPRPCAIESARPLRSRRTGARQISRSR